MKLLIFNVIWEMLNAIIDIKSIIPLFAELKMIMIK